MVNDLQRFTGKWLQQNIGNPLNAGYEHIRKPLNKLMPQQLGDGLISGAHLLNEFSPGADVRDIKQGGQKLFSNPVGGMTDIALGSVGMFPGVGDLAKGAALAGMGTFAGVGSKMADLVKLDKAKDMVKGGAKKADVWDATGWYKAPDGQWKYEIDDSGSSINRYTVNGKEKSTLHHPELRKAYPDMYSGTNQSYKIDDNMFKGDAGGTYNPNTKSIDIVAGSEDGARTGGLHEFQHAVQDVEGFATGGDPSRPMGVGFVGEEEQFDWAKKAYERRFGLDKGGMSDEDILDELRVSYGGKPKNKFSPKVKPKAWDDLTKREKVQYLEQGRHSAYQRLAGETEARNVEVRRDMTPEQRSAKGPWETQDFPDEEQLIRSPSGKAQSTMKRTDTPEFKNWFGDSKVVDDAGNPITVHHGGYGASKIEEFDPAYGGQTTGNNEHGAFHFTDNKEVADDYGRQSFNRRFQDDIEGLVDEGVVNKLPDVDDEYDYVANLAEENIESLPVNLQIENPYTLDMQGEQIDVQQIEELSAAFKAMNDGDWSNVPEEAMETIMEMGTYDKSDIVDYTDEITQKLLDDYDIPSMKDADGWELDAATDEVLSEAGIEKDYPNFDGIIIKNMIDDIGDMSNQVADQYIAFEPTQVKSIHNKGEYGLTNKNIYRGLAPLVGVGALAANKDLWQDTDKKDPWSIPRSN